MLTVFWLSACMIFYAYFGYPMCLLALSVVRKRAIAPPGPVSADPHLPRVSFIITAYNEERQMKAKIENSLAQDYPEDQLEIIVASDCSRDRTDEIVRAYAKKGVRLVRAPERKGKENAQRLAVQAARGQILVFSDVATILEPDGIRRIVANFADPSVGCVSSEDCFIGQDGQISGEGAYVRYEMFLRRLESRVNTVVGLSGSFFAARATVCENWAPNLQSDFNTLLNSIKLALRGISDPASIGYYKNIKNEQKEFDRKVRTVLRGITVLAQNLSLLNPGRHGLFAWQLFSHKLCRWLVPLFLALAFFTNTALLTSSFLFAGLLAGQIIFYFLAAYYRVVRQPVNQTKEPNYNLKTRLLSLSKIAFYFVTVNIAILVAWIRYLKGDRAVSWEPSRR